MKMQRVVRLAQREEDRSATIRSVESFVLNSRARLANMSL